MKCCILLISLLCLIISSCQNSKDYDKNAAGIEAQEINWDNSKQADITYQLLVYSFADSDNDRYGDINGIIEHLDYIDALGASAIWLSPIHPSSSYHGYDITDYNAVSSNFGTEKDLKSLIDAAHAKNIKVYLDYVLNHTSKDHPWFLEGKSNPESKYRNYYHFSSSAKNDYCQTIAGENPGKIKLKFTLNTDNSGKPATLTCSKADEIDNQGTKPSGKYLWYGSVTDNTMPEFYKISDTEYELSLELETDWGVLVRTSKTEWGSCKYGAATQNANILSWDTPLSLQSNSSNDILMPWMQPIWYQGVFSSYMPDLNYGPANTCETSDAFKDMCASADKWIELGIDGLRLDAVKHIYDNATSTENPTFLKKFYDHCNETYKAQGHQDDIYMVGEVFEEHNIVTPYYKGLPAFFEFSFWNRLQWAVSSNIGCYFCKDITGYRKEYAAVRSDAIAATKLTNHDESRAASSLNRNVAAEKLAACVLLTASGSPYIYQGEELGYWGTKDNGDEWVRTPVQWTATGTMADAALGGKVDKSMTAEPGISVEEQLSDKNSILNVYRTFGRLRNALPALAKGEMLPHEIYNDSNTAVKSISAWYMVYEDQKLLVLHNFGATDTVVNLPQDDLTQVMGVNAAVYRVEGDPAALRMGPYSSIILKQ